MVWSEGNMSLKNPVTPPGIDPGTVRLVAQRLNHYATLGARDKYQTKLNLLKSFIIATPHYMLLKPVKLCASLNMWAHSYVQDMQ